MNIPRRTVLAGIVSSAAAPWPVFSATDNWPRQRPITFIVPYPPGGVTDVQARTLAPLVSKILGQTIVIENRSGAGGSIGVGYAAHQPADGYTMVIGTQATHGANAALYKELRYQAIRDFAPVHGLFDSIPLLGVHPSRPYKNLKEFVAFAKANPGAIRYGSAGVGSGGHLVGEMFQQSAGIQLTHVPYKGVGPTINDLVGGHIDAAFDYPITLLQQVLGGRVRALSFMGSTRLASLPDVPSIVEDGFPLPAAKTWTILYMPSGTPAPIVSAMADAVEKAIASPEMRKLIDRFGGELMSLRGAALDKFSQDQYDRWREIVRRSGATLEG
ncbi:Bug family tripartite tricarboxylate transporter substrate binding protein [Ottowia thiooxydans]|uniref:Bug family tripartite tricarboxylate transporter substrate binding protein n=1 Tax=Ottowia thiooxydans TaxID=219182 RepID=UPI0004011342|nr:tripartite tricarboxylate transporter substrate binding protein [Ottowia thiooxydans]